MWLWNYIKIKLGTVYTPKNVLTNSSTFQFLTHPVTYVTNEPNFSLYRDCFYGWIKFYNEFYPFVPFREHYIFYQQYVIHVMNKGDLFWNRSKFMADINLFRVVSLLISLLWPPFSAPSIRSVVFIVFNTDTLRVINWLSQVYLYLYFDSGTFFVVHYGGRIENLSYSGCRKFGVI